ncbi:conserved Plasmodium protein, unknown function [Plasmodium berghei]|uniref:Uncharacterized protein n=1 Tax=Plasmodium berghei TaxID=5821 RepID=A0A1D3S6V0_PLABE|nr:conserved Plasmodium protein, unknown function [Plasmodium berghei]
MKKMLRIWKMRKKKKKKKKKNLYSVINELNYSNGEENTDNLEINLKSEKKKKKKNIIHINQDEVNNKTSIDPSKNIQTEFENINETIDNSILRNDIEYELSNQNSQNELNFQSTIINTNNNSSNIFLKVFDKIKKKIIDDKGQPIPSYIINDQDVCELNALRNSVSQTFDSNTGNNVNVLDNSHILNGTNDTLAFPIQLTEISQSPNNVISELSQEIEMVCLQGLNPNDVMNNNIFANNQNEQINIILENLNNSEQFEFSAPINNLDPSNSQNNPNQGSEYNLFPIKIYNEFLNKSKIYINTIKEKIIKYWQKKVEEANQQLTTQNQVSVQTQNENNIEDEYDDPSTIQVLLLLGLICKFPILWFIGSLILCVTPSNHTKTKRWGIISFFFSLATIIYYITTTNFNSYQPGFSTIIEQKKEQENIYKPGIIKFTTDPFNDITNVTISNFILLNKYSKYNWIDSSNNKLLHFMDNHFLDWPFIFETKPTSNIILSSNIYIFLNRIQITIIFGKGNIYSNKNIEIIKTDVNALPDIQDSIHFIKFDNITFTNEKIPKDFFGAGLRCELHDKTNKMKISEKSPQEKWYIFWKQYDNIHNKKLNNLIYNLFIPVGEIFFFKTEHKCRLAYIFPENINLNNPEIPNNFVEIEKIMIKVN